MPEHTSEAITVGKKLSVTSEKLGEERSYWVSLPASYDSTSAPMSYPVLYLLDGDSNFHFADGVVQFMSRDDVSHIPEMIIVAIPNTNRTRDLTPTHSMVGVDGKEEQSFKSSGGGRRFLRFMRDELFPKIESSYRTLHHRTIVGHSFGGLIALASLFDEPDMFQSYIAIDPSLWWDDQAIVDKAQNEYRVLRDRRASVYLSLANTPDIGVGDPSLPGREFSSSIAAAASQRFRSTLQYFDSEDHGSIPLLSLYHGLCFIYKGFKPRREEFAGKPGDLAAHYDRLSERLGMVLIPPRFFVGGLGHFHLLNNEPDIAIEFFKLNLSYHPGRFKMYDLMGEAYLAKGNIPLAIEYYEKSIELNPENENGKKQLENLKAGGGKVQLR